MKLIAQMVLALVGSVVVAPLLAAPEPVQTQKVEEITVYKGQWNGWITKVCIGDQFYLVGVQAYGPSAITPALRDGQPEQCDPTATTKNKDE
ncbi:hypothetical protein GXB82_21625 [Pseudomonas stutzeri]|nr:hypothetical protein [Stutzerimonas stutzeri]